MAGLMRLKAHVEAIETIWNLRRESYNQTSARIQDFFRTADSIAFYGVETCVYSTLGLVVD